jgi:hypothetical protein
LILENYQELFKWNIGPFQFSKADVKEALKKLMELLLQIPVNNVVLQTVDELFGYAELMGRLPVLIVDEANLVLGRDDGIDPTAKTLQTIVQLTKQTNQLTVIMASSEYGYPYKLVGEKQEQRFNLEDISSMLFVGKIPPWSMWDLLAKLEMGENLASLLIASYGGHFLRLSKAVDRLKAEKDNFFVACRDRCVLRNATATGKGWICFGIGFQGSSR